MSWILKCEQRELLNSHSQAYLVSASHCYRNCYLENHPSEQGPGPLLFIIRLCSSCIVHWASLSKPGRHSSRNRPNRDLRAANVILCHPRKKTFAEASEPTIYVTSRKITAQTISHCPMAICVIFHLNKSLISDHFYGLLSNNSVSTIAFSQPDSFPEETLTLLSEVSYSGNCIGYP